VTILEARRLAHPAREARKQYLADQFKAACNGDDLERESADWYAHLIAVCGRWAADPEISRWYALEESRLLKMIG
jgi:hypothetical protein